MQCNAISQTGCDYDLYRDVAKTRPDPPPYDRFGFFVKKLSVGAELGRYTVFTGETDPGNVSVIDRFNGEKELTFWNCRKA